jgi:hypothetical protein
MNQKEMKQYHHRLDRLDRLEKDFLMRLHHLHHLRYWQNLEHQDYLDLVFHYHQNQKYIRHRRLNRLDYH